MPRDLPQTGTNATEKSQTEWETEDSNSSHATRFRSKRICQSTVKIDRDRVHCGATASWTFVLTCIDQAMEGLV